MGDVRLEAIARACRDTTTFGESGDPRGLDAKFGFDPAGIAASVTKFLGR